MWNGYLMCNNVKSTHNVHSCAQCATKYNRRVELWLQVEIENSEHINTKYDIEDATQIQKRERGRLDT